MQKSEIHSQICFKPNEYETIVSFSKSEIGSSIRKQLYHTLEGESNGINIGAFAAGHALLALLDDDPSHLQQAQEITAETIAGVDYPPCPPLWTHPTKLIFRAAPAVHIAITYDLAKHLWPAKFSRFVRDELAAMAMILAQGGGEGYNNKPESNWQGSTKAAALLLAMAVRDDLEDKTEIDEAFKIAREKFENYCQAAIGENGWCREGFNYLRYPYTISIFQMLHAATLQQNANLEPAVHKARKAAQLYCMQLIPKQPFPLVPFHGLNYGSTGRPGVSGYEQYYETTQWRSGDLIMALGSCEEDLRPALLEVINEQFGSRGNGTWDIHKPVDAVYAMINLARHAEALDTLSNTTSKPANRENGLAKTCIDQQRGYALFRNRYQDENDCIVSMSYSPDPVNGTYVFHDAGSFRIISDGVHWATQQSRRDRDWGKTDLPNISPDLENVVRMPQVDQWQGGMLLSTQCMPDGSGEIHLDLSRTYSRNKKQTEDQFQIVAKRSMYVDYSGDSGSPHTIIIHDQFTGEGEKIWQMHSQGKIKTEGSRFTLTHEGKTMHGLAITPEGPTWQIQPGKESHCLRCHFDDQCLIVLSTSYLEGEAIEYKANASLKIHDYKIVLRD